MCGWVGGCEREGGWEGEGRGEGEGEGEGRGRGGGGVRERANPKPPLLSLWDFAAGTSVAKLKLSLTSSSDDFRFILRIPLISKISPPGKILFRPLSLSLSTSAPNAPLWGPAVNSSEIKSSPLSINPVLKGDRE